LKTINFFNRFPFSYEKSPEYEIVYTLAAWEGFTTATGFGCMVGIFFGISIHASGQFDILSLRLQNLMQREFGEISNDLNLTRRQNALIFKKLQEIVEQHDKLINLCEKMSNALTVIVICHFVSAAVVLCACCMMMVRTQIPEWFIYFLYAVGAVTEAYIFGYGGSALIYSSNGMKDAAYNFEWYKCDTRNRKTILFIMQRAQRKVCIEVPFFQASLEAFVAVSI